MDYLCKSTTRPPLINVCRARSLELFTMRGQEDEVGPVPESQEPDSLGPRKSFSMTIKKRLPGIAAHILGQKAINVTKKIQPICIGQMPNALGSTKLTVTANIYSACTNTNQHQRAGPTDKSHFLPKKIIITHSFIFFVK